MSEVSVMSAARSGPANAIHAPYADHHHVVGFIVGTTALTVTPASATTIDPTFADPTGGSGSYLLTATNPGDTYAPTFTGNGELGIRVPPTGQGYAGGRCRPRRSSPVSTPSRRAECSRGPTCRPGRPHLLGRWSTILAGNGNDQALAPVDRPEDRCDNNQRTLDGAGRSRDRTDLPGVDR